ncbi:hypothetical protein Goklo_024304 [Gossypium klotzschianum]|uniref:Uncharacterized protein n=1 Tax=Gossypium klotzschianum TaxID=34286 RepID=A0A7J8WCZ6_9ROSI|nr:hypothetical protein [Gossypium klotzschianum]
MAPLGSSEVTIQLTYYYVDIDDTGDNNSKIWAYGGTVEVGFHAGQGVAQGADHAARAMHVAARAYAADFVTSRKYFVT